MTVGAVLFSLVTVGAVLDSLLTVEAVLYGFIDCWSCLGHLNDLGSSPVQSMDSWSSFLIV